MAGSYSAGSNSILRQLSSRESWNSSSKRWSKKAPEKSLKHMEGYEIHENGLVLRKRVIVVVDHSTRAKHAMMWALTHVTNKGDLLTLLEIIPPNATRKSLVAGDSSPDIAHSLGSLCKACKPEVEIEALVIQGPKLATALSQVKKLEASVLVLGQKKPSPLHCLFRSSTEEFVEQCINNADCLTLAVRKQKTVGGYLISTRWQKNFWLLA